MKVACTIDGVGVRARMLTKANNIARAKAEAKAEAKAKAKGKAKAKEIVRATNVQKCSQSYAPQVP
jgi:hypothetical protein